MAASAGVRVQSLVVVSTTLANATSFLQPESFVACQAGALQFICAGVAHGGTWDARSSILLICQLKLVLWALEAAALEIEDVR
jgi:hypothetical protein